MNSLGPILGDLVIIAILIGGIWRFRAPETARSGNLAAALALLGALGLVVLGNAIREPATVVLAVVAGGALGCLVAARVNMLQVPALVAFQHGAGGVAAFLTSLVELSRPHDGLFAVGRFSGVLGVVIGAATFSGSMIAGAKLAGAVRATPVILPKHHWILAAALLGIGLVGSLTVRATGPALLHGLLALVLLSIVAGAVFALRIGGADMPVLISFLNATAGLAAAFCGIIIQNRLLIACGATVAASGSILTHVMCQAMNRNLLKVLMPADAPTSSTASPLGSNTSSAPAAVDGPKASSLPEATCFSRAVEALRSAQTVIIIPGYGMALAHAQNEVVRLADRLQEMGKRVRFAIHPIAGRMPGHMHVLLGEADVDPDLLFDLKEINAEFQKTDLALIVGACDVVNPAAIHVQGTPISGMPILAAHEARQVLVCNMDEKPGYSGVANPLYGQPNAILMFGDAKATFNRLRQAVG